MKLEAVAIETNNACNLHCEMCGNSGMRRKRQFMEMELFRTIVDDAVRCGVGNIHLHTIGEPLLHPHCCEMVRYVRSRGIRCWLATNGMLLEDRTSRALLESDLSALRVSVEGSEQAVTGKVRRGASFETIFSNLHRFSELRRTGNYRTHVGINTIVMKETLPDMDKFVGTWGPLCNGIEFSLLSGQGHDNEFYREQQIADCVSGQRRPCDMFLHKLAVTVEGCITACCIDFENDFIVGHIGDVSLSAAFNGRAMNRLRHLHNQRRFTELPCCDKCAATWRPSMAGDELLEGLRFRYYGLHKGKTPAQLESLRRRGEELGVRFEAGSATATELHELFQLLRILGEPETVLRLIALMLKILPMDERLGCAALCVHQGDAFRTTREAIFRRMATVINDPVTLLDIAFRFDVDVNAVGIKTEAQ
jgi:pyruvate-formate lyase-activating enzyme